MPGIETGRCLATIEIARVLYVGLWVMLAAVLAIGGLRIAVVIRRRLHAAESPPPFTLQDLRDMRARQEITEQEFNALRAGLLAQLRRADVAPGTTAPQQPPPRPAGAPDDDVL